MRRRVINSSRNLRPRHPHCHVVEIEDGWPRYDREVRLGFGLSSWAAQSGWDIRLCLHVDVLTWCLALTNSHYATLSEMGSFCEHIINNVQV